MKISLIWYSLIFFLSFSDHFEESRKEEAFSVYLKDSLLHKVNLIYDEQNRPDLYHCFVESPVCDDGLCKLVVVHLYWDLLGNFHHFELPDGRPLTKFDHVEFTREDYLKLRDILKNKHSLLGIHKVEELIDESTQLVSDSVDATTGATRKTVKKAVVGGAVYSTYTLWHIVYGKIANKINSFTQKLVDQDLLQKFLLSDNHHYHHFTLDHFSAENLDLHRKGLINLIVNGNIFVAEKAVKKVSTSLDDHLWQAELTRIYDDIIYQKQQFILEALQSEKLHKTALQQLTGYLPEQSEVKVKQILSLVEKNSKNVNDHTVQNIVQLFDSPNPAFAELGLSTLKKIEENNKLAGNSIKNYEKRK